MYVFPLEGNGRIEYYCMLLITKKGWTHFIFLLWNIWLTNKENERTEHLFICIRRWKNIILCIPNLSIYLVTEAWRTKHFMLFHIRNFVSIRTLQISTYLTILHVLEKQREKIKREKNEKQRNTETMKQWNEETKKQRNEETKKRRNNNLCIIKDLRGLATLLC